MSQCTVIQTLWFLLNKILWVPAGVPSPAIFATIDLEVVDGVEVAEGVEVVDGVEVVEVVEVVDVVEGVEVVEVVEVGRSGR